MKILAWCHLNRDFASGRDEAERTFDCLSEAGIDTLLPFAYGGGSCWYDSGLPGVDKEDRLGPVIEMALTRFALERRMLFKKVCVSCFFSISTTHAPNTSLSPIGGWLLVQSGKGQVGEF